ncbi:hypothetical protein GCM10020229_15140 [Kitasatospora albolonga]
MALELAGGAVAGEDLDEAVGEAGGESAAAGAGGGAGGPGVTRGQFADGVRTARGAVGAPRMGVDQGSDPGCGGGGSGHRRRPSCGAVRVRLLGTRGRWRWQRTWGEVSRERAGVTYPGGSRCGTRAAAAGGGARG